MKHIPSSTNVLYFDADGILLDFVRPFLAWAYEYNMVDCCPDSSIIPSATTFRGYGFTHGLRFHHDVKALIDMFQNRTEFANLPSTALVTDLEMLKLCGYTLNVCTKVTGLEARKKRLWNITTKYPGIFDRVLFCPPELEKQDFLWEYYPYGILIEDCPDTIRYKQSKIYTVGINDISVNPFLAEEMYQLEDEGLPVFDSVSELSQYLIKYRIFL